MFVSRVDLGLPDAFRRLEHRSEPVRHRFVGSDQTERGGIRLDDVSEQFSEHPGRFHPGRARSLDGYRVVGEVRHGEVLEQEPAVGVWVGAHAARARRRERSQLGAEAPGLVEELLGPVAAHPGFEHGQVLGIRADLAHGHLVGPERALDRQAVHGLGPRPALGRAQDDHGPRGTTARGAAPGRGLDVGDLVEGSIERGGQLLVDVEGVVAGDEDRAVTVALEQPPQLVVADPSQDRRVGDLVTVQMEDGQHCAVTDGVEELVGVPGCRQAVPSRPPRPR